ncbi:MULTISPECIES: ribosome small subunit-dependent GTPase A [unclassified Massilia]|uniref:ribosome small subunit-dependent GTPase A n=1 Tax=unclassified Massilia TaxID=2609279 RepID=UPI001B82BC0D|nr:MULTISPECIES: ribosome small subunit-dependent GTPase A [unclassified Massilia]MBQ5939907.1 ribosome small subunit-dependent GTPase A [Massilia sp. AB1]MBQ5965233.1 ribosome small subunit-dependent GTPase A [Massilia sp. ZL223]
MIDIDYPTLQGIGFHHHLAAQLAQAGPQHRLARVTSVQRDCLMLDDGREAFLARSTPPIASSPPVVGDWVLAVQVIGDYWIDHVLEPSTRLARRTAGGRQVLAANVDTALLLMGLDKDFNPRRMERYIAVVRACGVAPVMVLTKSDIGSDAGEKIAQLRRRIPEDVPALAVHPAEQSDAGLLAPWLGAGQTLVLLGSSGVGKSTLTNALAGSLQATGGTRYGDDRGRHTTTARSLHRCPGGACIIDTPGLRAWQPDADEDDLEQSFNDIAALGEACQFRDCQHESEPGCAVRDVVDADRLRNYRKLLREVRRAEQTALDRIAERAKWKTLMKGARLRGREKRGG